MASERRIGIVVCGIIGRKVAAELDVGSVPGARLVALSSRNMERARKVAAGLSRPPRVLPLPDMVPLVGLVVEVATCAALAGIAKETLAGERI